LKKTSTRLGHLSEISTCTQKSFISSVSRASQEHQHAGAAPFDALSDITGDVANAKSFSFLNRLSVTTMTFVDNFDVESAIC